MTWWLLQIADKLAAALLTAAILALIYRWRASALRSRVQAGGPVRFSAWLRASTTPYPRRWRGGWVMLGNGTLRWKPSFSSRPPIDLPLTAVVERIRPISGLRETYRLSSRCSVIVARTQDGTLELAVYTLQLNSVLQALESQSGGGWQVPSTLPVTVVKGGEVTNYEVRRW